MNSSSPAQPKDILLSSFLELTMTAAGVSRCHPRRVNHPHRVKPIHPGRRDHLDVVVIYALIVHGREMADR